jgi:hypothetical protein
MYQSEHNYISNKWYIKFLQYQLYVSASILAIVRLYSAYPVTIQYAWGTGEGGVVRERDLIYSSG